MSKRKKKNRYRKSKFGKTSDIKDYLVIQDTEGVRVAIINTRDKAITAIRRNPNIRVICEGAFNSPENAREWANIISN